ncbi:MAG: NADH-quinone oxidoreductase subunit M [Myxococcota bacterium]|jgi:NADH-quinone oxidoreductase subunit M
MLFAAHPFVELPSQIPILSLVCFLPLLGAFMVALTPRDNPTAARGLGLFFSVATFVASLFVWKNFADTAGFQMVDRAEWVPGGIGYAIGIDGISLLLVMLTTLLTPLTLWASHSTIDKRVKEFVVNILILETGMLGGLLALDLFLFFVFWEAMLIPMYLLIGIWGGKDRIYATMKFFMFTMVGSVLMLVGIIYLYVKTGSTSSALVDVLSLDLSRPEQLWLFAAFGLAFAIKVPLFPLHTWLPDAHTQAPTAGSVILAGIMLKLGTYALLRFAFPLFPEAVGTFSGPIMALATIGIIYGALVAYNQTDVKKLVAYSSVSHLGFVVLGMFALTKPALEGALLQMVNHGISTGGLFLCVGMLYERRHTRAIADYGGIAKKVPIFTTFFMIMTLSSIGLPGTNGFVGEFLILLGTFREALGTHLDLSKMGMEFATSWRVLVTVFATIATMGVVVGAIYMLSMFRRVMFGPLTNPENEDLQDMTGREIGYMLPLAALVFIIGLFPNIFLDKMHRSVDAFIDHTRPTVTEVRSPETVAIKKQSALAARGGGRN